MKTALISIVSDQTIPNIQLALEFKDKIDFYFFVTTQSKSHITNNIIKALNLQEEQCQLIPVDENNTSTITADLQKYSESYEQYNLIVNYSCGTKLLSMAVYNYFSPLNNAYCYYVNTNNTYLDFEGKTQQFHITLTVEQYLIAYALEFKKGKYQHTKEVAENIYEKYTAGQLREIIRILRPHRSINKKTIDLSTELDEQQKSILSDILSIDNVITKDDIKYITGEWFEEYCAYQIINQYNLSQDAVWIGTNLNHPINANSRKSKNKISDYLQKEELLTAANELTKELEQNTNEIDVMFIYQNKLYVIECKTNLFNENRLILDETLYKIDSIKQKFGLQPQSIIATLFDIENYVSTYEIEGKPYNLKGNLKRIISNINRANNSGIKILDRKFFNSNKSFKDALC